jgi:UDP-N-acetylmuramoyl-tripeptide--D-alanyl-D-alanine ligase
VITLPPSEAARALGVEQVTAPVIGVSTDTRDLKPGDLFVALVGERYDGHAFVPAAFAAGASGVVVEMGRSIAGDPEWRPPTGNGRVYRVPDSLRALGALARAVRRRSDAVVVGVTGSVGKTGTKDLIHAMASVTGPVVATAANLNNEVGVPLTLLRLETSTRVAVVEMGMRGRGQIAELAAVAEPDVGVITRLAPVHLETLGTMEEVARAKAELLKGLHASGTAVIRAGEELLEPTLSACNCRVLRFALAAGQTNLNDSATADVTGSPWRSYRGVSGLRLVWPGGNGVVPLPFTARHKLENAVAATAACYAAGLSVEACITGLSASVLTPARGDEIRLGETIILDDTYNANPVSMRAALDWLAEVAAGERLRPVAVLGEMLELGSDSDSYHEQVGAYAAQVGVETLFVTGEHAPCMVEGFCAAGGDETRAAVFTMEGVSEAPGRRQNRLPASGIEDLLPRLGGREVVLVKASRGIRLERVVAALESRLNTAGVVS